MKSLYPEGHDVFGGDLQFTETSREFEDRQRMVALVGDQFGIVSGFDVTDNSDVSDNKLVISAGLAFDALGYRLNMVSGTTVSGILPSDIGNYVAIYVENQETNSTAHPVTGASAYTREVDGVTATIVSSVASGSGHVMVACITNVVTGAIPSVDFSTSVRSCREELTIDPDRLGTGLDVAEHRRSAHSDGISGGTTSLVPSIFDAATDYIVFTQMDSTHWVAIGGVLLGSEEVNPVSDVTFSTVVDAAGSWNIYMDSSGATGKTQGALTADQFLIATVTFDNVSGDLSSLVDSRVFYETTQDLVRVDLVEAETNDSLSAASTAKNNLNRLRYRLLVLETTGRAHIVIANSGGDYNGATDAVFVQALAAMPASGGTIVVADGVWNFSGSVAVNKTIKFLASENTIINTNTLITPYTTFAVTADNCTFDGFTFSVDNTTSGNLLQHVVGFTDCGHGQVINCALEAATTAGTVGGELVLVNGGSEIDIYKNHYHTDDSQMFLVRVSATNTVSGLSVRRNSTEGAGSANLLHVNSGAVDNLDVTHNRAVIGLGAAGYQSWIVTDAGTAIYGMTVSNNNYYCVGTTAVLTPIGVICGHTGDLVLSSNTFRFTDPGTTTPLAISIGGPLSTLSNNIIRDANIALGISSSYSTINSNAIIGATGTAVSITGDNNVMVGNTIQGGGAVGLNLSGDNNIIDDNQIHGFTDDISDTGADNYVDENPVSDHTVNVVTT